MHTGAADKKQNNYKEKIQRITFQTLIHVSLWHLIISTSTEYKAKIFGSLKIVFTCNYCAGIHTFNTRSKELHGNFWLKGNSTSPFSTVLWQHRKTKVITFFSSTTLKLSLSPLTLIWLNTSDLMSTLKYFFFLALLWPSQRLLE